MSRIRYWLFAGVCAYSFLAASFVTFRVQSCSPDFFEYHALALLLFCAVALFSGSEQEPPIADGSKKAKLAFILTFALAGAGLLITRGLHYHEGSIWVDEYIQAVFSKSLCVTRYAAHQQQTPLDYYFSKLSVHVMGTTEFAARFHALCFGILAGALFLLSLARLRLHPVMIAVGAFIFIFNKELIFHSIDGRPISGAIFFELVYLNLLADYLLLPRPGMRAFLRLLGGQILFLLSTGLQPAITVAGVSLSVLPWLISLKRKREAAGIVAVGLLSLLLILPNLVLVYIESDKENQFYRDFSARFMDWVRLWSWDHFRFFKEWTFPFLLAALIAFTVAVTKPAVRWPLISLGIFSVLYPILFLGIYEALVNWPIDRRYYLTFLPAFLLGLFGAAARAAHAIQGTPFRALLACFFLAFAYPGWLGFKSHGEAYARKKSAWLNWEGLYSELGSFVQEGDRAYLFPLHSFGKWPIFFVAREFYIPESSTLRKVLRDGHIQRRLQYNDGIEEDLVSESVKGRAILLIEKGRLQESHAVLDWVRVAREAGVLYRTNPDFHILTIESQGDPIQRFERLLLALIREGPDQEWNYISYETLARMRLLRADKAEARRYVAGLARVLAPHLKASTGLSHLARRKVEYYAAKIED